jgi:hypothetical protein
MPNSIVDPTIEEVGNPQRALDTIQELSATKSEPKKDDPKPQTGITDPRFKDKSAEEIYTAYRNLEQLQGQQAYDLGRQRQLTDQLLAQKRENDLRANGAQAQAQAKVTATDLLENPQEALDRYFESRRDSTVDQLKQRTAQLEQQLTQTSFVAKHPDWQEHTNDPAFVEWARQTPWRMRLAQEATANNLQSADALLSEYKASKPNAVQSEALESARKVGLERSASSGEDTRPPGKIIRRADMRAMRVNNPELYESPAVQNALLLAIKEGRYQE